MGLGQQQHRRNSYSFCLTFSTIPADLSQQIIIITSCIIMREKYAAFLAAMSFHIFPLAHPLVKCNQAHSMILLQDNMIFHAPHANKNVNILRVRSKQSEEKLTCVTLPICPELAKVVHNLTSPTVARNVANDSILYWGSLIVFRAHFSISIPLRLPFSWHVPTNKSFIIRKRTPRLRGDHPPDRRSNPTLLGSPPPARGPPA